MDPFKTILEMNNRSQLTDLTNVREEYLSYGVVSGLLVAAQASPNMTVKVSAGVVYMPTTFTRFSLSAVASITITTADATNPRWDIIYVSAAGVITYLAGTAAASPSVPSVPSGGVNLANIYVAATDTAISATEISDMRKFLWTEQWIKPTLLNSWVELDADRTPMYMKDIFGFVHLKGCIKSGTIGNSAFTLPEGYRPLGSAARAFPVKSAGAFGSVDINSTLGSVTPTVGGTGSFYLDSVIFMAGV